MLVIVADDEVRLALLLRPKIELLCLSVLFLARRIIENDLFKHDWRSRSNVEVLQYIFLKWAMAFLVGLLTGVDVPEASASPFIAAAHDNRWHLLAHRRLRQGQARGDVQQHRERSEEEHRQHH